MRMRRILVVGLLGSLLVPYALAGQSGERLARDILEATGVQGGFIVHIGCGDGKLTAALRVDERYLVHGLDSDARNVELARRHLQKLGVCGPVAIDRLRDEVLPYTDNLVSLLVVEESPEVPTDELMRVLRPGGVAYVKTDGGRKKTVKAWPADIDEWTHFLHGPDNNAVAEDTQVAPPHHVQWIAGPRWGRSHDHLASMSAAVSAAGRLFYIVDEGAIASVKETSHWQLVARDAFNGVLLWKKRVGPWEDQLRPFRSGPAELPRRLVASGERVYVTLGYGKPVVALDAATGEEVCTYEGTENTHEIVYHEGKLYLVISDPLAEELAKESGTTGTVIRRLPHWRDFYHRFVTQYPAKRIQCMHADSGELLWQKKDGDTKHILPMTPALSGDRLFFENEKEILALEADTGQIVWRAVRPVVVRRYAWSAPTLVVKDGVVLSADRSPELNLDTGGGDTTDLEWLVTANHLLTGGEIIAFSAETGKRLWTAPCHEGFNAPVDVFVAHGKVWSGELAWGKQPGITEVYDLQTGEVVARRPADQECYTLGFGHTRCYRHKATTKYVLHGRAGVEFLDMNSNRVVADHWVRGTCQYGILPCNGLLYAPPHSCACYVEAKLDSFNALARKRADWDPPSGTGDWEGCLETGLAYDGLRTSRLRRPGTADWPTYRGDNRRSGVADVSLPASLTRGWEKKFPGRLTGVVVAAGKLFFAQIDRHTVQALGAADGSSLWEYTTGGRVDSPPTIHGGYVYFGSADGWVYCLDGADGTLAWRFRLAPEGRRTVSYDQVESVWPVPGNVLVQADRSGQVAVYAVAGRSSFLDGGMFLHRLDARTGKLLFVQRISHRDPVSGQEPQETVRGTAMPGALPDILSTDGSSIFMRHLRFDLNGMPLAQDVDHLYSPAGFLDSSWWHRTYWQVGRTMRGGYGGWSQIGNQRISGRLLVQEGDRVFGFGRKGYGITGSHTGLNTEYHLFSADTDLIRPAPTGAQKKKRRMPPTQVRYHWSKPLPFYARAMLLAGETLFVAGPEKVTDLDAQRPTGSVWLWAISATDGKKQAEYKLDASPVFDSFAATEGRLYLTTVDGRILSLQAI